MWRILPSSCSCLQLADLVGHGVRRVDAVQLEQVDALEAEAAQAELDLLAQVRRLAERGPLARALAGQAGLGRDDHVVGVRVQRLAQQVLGDVGAVGVGGVEEGDPDLDGPTQHGDRLGVVARRTPDALAGQLHRAVAEAYDGQVAAELEGAGRCGEVLGGRAGIAFWVTRVSSWCDGWCKVRGALVLLCSRVPVRARCSPHLAK